MQKNSNKSIYGFLILLIFLSLTFSFQQIFICLNSSNYNTSANFPLTSANEITLITPENKSYSEPMAGYFPGTFGFENELDGASRTSIAYVDGTNAIYSNCEVEITNNYQGHNKVLRVHDGNTAGNAGAEHYFDPIQTTGTTEWWWLIPTAGDFRMWVHFHQDQIGTVALSLGAINGEFFQTNGTAVQSYNNNQWYHHKVSFDTSSDMYDWYIDGTLVVNGGAFENPVSSIGSTHIKGAWTTTGESYFDAFGYSWDPNYNIGDNLNEGLLISYSNSTNLDWIGYSLDGLVNKTILGNAAIPMPVNGVHSIQVFGNNSLGTMYESDLRYFTIRANLNITINTPENTTYSGPMSGYYPATYGFESDEVGNIPEDWVDLSDPTCKAQVIAEKNGYKKILELSDNSASALAQATQTFKTAQVTGEIEWWWSSDDVTKLNRFQVYATDNTQAIVIQMDSDKFQYYDSPTVTDISGVTPLDDIWYHLKLIFDCSSDTFDLYIDGILRLNDGNFRNVVNDCKWLRIQTGDGDSSYYQDIDAIGYSWDTKYSAGDNLKEGLLLSYENSTNLDWIGYSLDGSPNITITGNMVIPYPEIGIHSIILNGITSNGVSIKSDLRYFTIFINIQDPPIPPDNPNLIPIILTIIGIGIIALLGITLFLFRRKISSRTSSTIISRKKSQSDDHVDSGSDQFKTCPKCHTQIKKTDQFCEYCGVSLKND